MRSCLIYRPFPGTKLRLEESREEIRTAGDHARVRLRPDRESIQADGYDLSFVTVRIEDESGTLCPIADNLVRVEREGPGEIAAVGNGNAATTEPFQADYRRKE